MMTIRKTKGSRDASSYEGFEVETTRLIEDLDTVIQEHLDLNRFGFKEIYRYTPYPKGPYIIYENNLCKVYIHYVMERYSWHDNIRIYYGRKHAVNDSEIIDWKGKKYWCWHNANPGNVIDFLDGLTPEEAKNRRGLGSILDAFKNSPEGSSLEYNLPELSLREHKLIIDNYAPRIFELFDTKNSALWQKYSQFVKDYYLLLCPNLSSRSNIDNSSPLIYDIY